MLRQSAERTPPEEEGERYLDAVEAQLTAALTGDDSASPAAPVLLGSEAPGPHGSGGPGLHGSGGPGLHDSAAPTLLAAARDLCIAGGGKRVRPRLTFYFGQACGAPFEGLVDVGVAGELIHAGSLLHDDVIDEGTRRRGRPTVNARWGNTVAILAGDLMLTLAFVQVRGWPPEITDEAVDTIAGMTRAAMAEVEVRGRLDLPVDAWRGIVEGKTGALFAWCGRSAARLAGAADAVLRFGACGRHLGVAFQLADDVLDLAGQRSGKDLFADLRNREPSYPILRAASTSPALAGEIAKLWGKARMSDRGVAAIAAAIVDTGALEATAAKVEVEVEAAIEALGGYAEAPGGRDIAYWARLLAAQARSGAPA